MFERSLDNRLVRITLGTAIGLPLTAAALVCAMYGVMLFFGGLSSGSYLIAGLGPVTVFGLLGIAGAWRRLLKPHASMNSRERKIVRSLLLAGVAASVILAIVSLVSTESYLLVLFFTALTGGGLTFVLATPNAF